MTSASVYDFQGSLFQIMAGLVGSSPLASISGITQADPPVVTSSAHGLSDGDAVKITGVVGMTQLNNKIFIVNVLDVNTFELLGVNTTGYGAYVSGGNFDEVTFSDQWCQVTSYNRTGGTSPEKDRTTVCSNAREFALGLPDFGNTSIDYFFAPQESVQLALQGFYRSREIIAVRVVLPNNGGTMVQMAFVQQTSEQTAVDGDWTGSLTLRNTGFREDFA